MFLKVSSLRLPLINILFDCFVTSGTKIHTSSHSYMYVSRTRRKNHAAMCISHDLMYFHKCKHQTGFSIDILFSSRRLNLFFFFVIYIFDFNKMPHGQLHVFNVCLLFIHRTKLSSTLNISRLSQQTFSPFF